MGTEWSVVAILLFSFTEQTIAHQNDCPSWFVPDNTSSTGCLCYNSREEVKCGSDFTLLHLGFCMTYDNTTETTEYGPCPYLAHYNTADVDHLFYTRLPHNVSLLNQFMCGPLNREGPLCERCKDGYGTALYSYTLECSKCWGHGYGWVLYYLLEFIPITVLYLLVVVFHIQATSSPLSALVFMSQIVVYTIRLNVPLHMYIENEVTGFPYVAMKVLLVLCGIWSLDFFRSVIPPFCVSSNIKTIHALALEYLVAFYPIFLILITYVCIKLHDNNFRPVVWLWKPFHRHFTHLRRRWDSRASIVNAFTTFMLLSFSKILFVTFTLLYTFSIRYNDSHERKCVMYYSPTVGCYTKEHSRFAAIAICVLVVFIISPTILLILYPTRLFGRCVSCCGFRKWHALHMFVESFQGEYKDGTNGTWDFRMVSASFLILRILIVASFIPHHYAFWPSSEQRCVVLISVCGFYATTRPYKSNFRNNVDILILVLLAILLLTFYTAKTKDITFCFLVPAVLLSIPHMMLIFYICYELATKLGTTLCLKMVCNALFVQATRHASKAETDVEAQSDTGLLPDRLVNPEEYEPLIPTTEEHTVAEFTENKDSVSEDPSRLTLVYTYGSIS